MKFVSCRLGFKNLNKSLRSRRLSALLLTLGIFCFLEPEFSENVYQNLLKKTKLKTEISQKITIFQMCKMDL